MKIKYCDWKEPFLSQANGKSPDAANHQSTKPNSISSDPSLHRACFNPRQEDVSTELKGFNKNCYSIIG